MTKDECKFLIKPKDEDEDGDDDFGKDPEDPDDDGSDDEEW